MTCQHPALLVAILNALAGREQREVRWRLVILSCRTDCVFTVIYFYIMFHVRNDQIVNILKFLLTKQKEKVINCGTANVCSMSNKIIFFQN